VTNQHDLIDENEDRDAALNEGAETDKRKAPPYLRYIPDDRRRDIMIEVGPFEAVYEPGSIRVGGFKQMVKLGVDPALLRAYHGDQYGREGEA
jgi:hypothetical protein